MYVTVVALRMLPPGWKLCNTKVDRDPARMFTKGYAATYVRTDCFVAEITVSSSKREAGAEVNMG